MITKTVSDCSHPESKLNYAWSHGNAGRCDDCGAIDNGGEWDDVVSNYAALEAFVILEKDSTDPKIMAAVEAYRKAIKYNREFMRIADRQDGMGYQENVNAVAAQLIAEAPKRP